MENQEWFSFHRQTLLQQLKNILREYHDEVQILHEIAQNAEDAGASILKLMHVRRPVEPGGFYGCFFKSPALCVYNDAVFTEDDWTGITSMCLSPKEEKRDKIGRYGQGFKSIFHITDYTTVISGDKLLVIDPSRVDKECQKLRLRELETTIKNSELYNAFDMKMSLKSGDYKGTLFWFPLRKRESLISKKTWNDEQMQMLFTSFKDEMHLVLMFLKHLQHIEIRGMGRHETLLQQVRMIYPDNKRSELIKESSICLRLQQKCFTSVSNVEMSVTDERNYNKKYKYTIAHYCATKTDMSDRFAKLATDSGIGCIPYVGIAFQHRFNNFSDGRVFNFLPFPSTVKTNLPVHINANFAVSQNRREIKQTDWRIKDEGAEWNDMLAEELLPKVYVNVIHHLIDTFASLNGSNADRVQMIYNCFPQGERYVYIPLWSKLIAKFYRLITNERIFYSKLRIGGWYGRDTVVVFKMGKLIGYHTTEHDEVEKVVKDILLKCGKAVVELYSNMDYLLRHISLNEISRSEIIDILQKFPKVYKNLNSLSKVRLLQYLIQSSSDELQFLELIPLCNGKFASFDIEGEKVYVGKPEEIEVFVGMEHRFVSIKIPDPLLNDLLDMAGKGRFQLRTLKLEDIPGILFPIFQHHSFEKENGEWVPKADIISKVWINLVWELIIKRQRFPFDMKSFHHIPLIPQFSDNGKLVKLYNLHGEYVIDGGKGRRRLPEKIKTMLSEGGIRVLTSNDILESYGLIGKYITLPSFECIMALCKNKTHLKNKLQAYVGDGDLWMPKNTTARSFGQREELVTRLKNILSTYPEKTSVLKEILQNADDAGASEVHFVYDKRNHKSKKIFNDNWKPLQGPALCVFNNACFTDTDLKGIEDLGIGSKAEDCTKTGQFGLGFNAVYHLTDAPMILSIGKEAALGGGMFCVLDPHCRYAPKADVYGPGMIMEVQELKQQQGDVFDTFLTQSTLKYSCGTWFRFPLRSIEMAHHSQIVQNACTNEDMIRLLEHMVIDIKEGMLFLLNVSTVTICIIDNDSRKTVIGRVQIEQKDASQEQHLKFKTCLTEYNKVMKSNNFDISLLSMRDFNYFVDIKDEVKNCISTWFIVQTLGFSNPERVDSRLQRSMELQKIQILPRGGVALKITESSEKHKPTKPKAFCLLPLEIETGLTVHINGQFAVDMSRSTLWGSDIESSEELHGIWNLNLIRWNIAYAYACCIYYFKGYFCTDNQANIEQYCALFPLYCKAKNDFWKELVYHLFLHLKLQRLSVFPIITSDHASGDKTIEEKRRNKITWLPRHEPMDTSVLVDVFTYRIKNEEEMKLHDTFVELGMKLISFPTLVCTSIIDSCTYYHNKQKRLHCDRSFDAKHEEQACVCLERLSPTAAIDFFKSCQSKIRDRFQVSSLKMEQVPICLKYCLQVDDWNALKGVPLLLNGNQIISYFRETNDLILSQFAWLLPNLSDKFVHDSLLELLYPYRQHFTALTWERFVKLLPESMSLSKFKPQYTELLPATQSDIRWCEGFWKFVDKTLDSNNSKPDASIQDLKDWCLLPVILNSTRYLFPLLWCKHTVLNDSFAPNSKLFKILTQFNMPIPLVESTVLTSLVATYENPENMLSCMYFWRNNINTTSLTDQQCYTLIVYLIRNIGSHQREYISKLKALKLFTSFNGDRIHLPEHGLFVLVSESFNVPTCGLKELFKRWKMTVIADMNDIWATKLFKLLGCQRLDMVTLYVNHILPRLESLSDENIMIHLEFINKNLLDDFKLTSNLPSFYLIPSEESIKKGSYFYDPECTFFVSMCETSELPPPPFCTPYWREFMICAGMNIKLTEKILLAFARKMGRFVHTNSIEEKSEWVVGEFVNYVHRENVSNSFLAEISNIPFILINTDISKYESIHESFETGVRLACFRGSLSSSNTALAWTTATILPNYATPNSNMRKRLNILETPNFETVERHTRNICSRLESSCPIHDQYLIEEIMTDIYIYFSRFISQMDSLRNIPIIHHQKQKIFLRGYQIIENLSIEEEIPSYLLKAPVNYGKFFELFRTLGMYDSPDVNTYCRVLEDIHKVARSHCLIDPSLLECTRRAIRGLMQCLKRLKGPLDCLAVDTLYILSEDNVLTSSSLLYYDSLEVPREDLQHIKDVNFIADLRCIGLNVAQVDPLFKCLPKKNRPLSITSLLSINVKIGKLIDNDKGTTLQESLTSDIFITCILRIIKHDHLENDKGTVSEEFMKSTSATLRRLRVNVVSTLLTHHENKEKHWSSDPQDRPCYFEESTTILYISGKDFGIDQWLQCYDVLLEREIQRLCQGMFKTGSLMPILSQIVTHLRDLDEKLTNLGIPYLENDVLKRIWFPLPGSLVPLELIQYLHKPLRPIPVKQYAVVRHFDVEAFDSYNEDEIYMYCIVTGYDSVHYTVNVGKSTDIKVTSDNIYGIRQDSYDTDDSDDDNDTFFKHQTRAHSFDDLDGHGTAGFARDFYASAQPNPQKPTGRIWFEQASWDLRTGKTTIEKIDYSREEVKGYNWVCLMCQQAAEKAIKGAQYATDANKVFRTHVLYENIPTGDTCLQDMACELSRQVGNINRLRYPEYSRLPAEMYGEDDARKALNIADKILCHIKRKYFF